MSDVTTSSAAPAATTTESTSTGEGDAGATQATPEQKAAVQAAKERFKYTIDGEDVEEEVDLSDKETIKKRFQQSHALEKRMAEVKATKAKAFDIVKAFESDPASILKRLGPKGREAAEKFLLEQIQDDMLTPEEKEFRTTKAELAKYKEQETKAKEEAEKAKISAAENKYAQEFQATIISALEKSGLPKTPALVKRMAGLMQKNLTLGLQLTADDLVIEAKKDVTGTLQALIKDADGEQLVAMFGEEIANKIRKSDLKKLQEKHDLVFQSKTQGQGSPDKSREGKPMSMTEWKESLNQRFK